MNGPIMPMHGIRVRRRAPLPPPIRSLVKRLPRVPSSAVVATMLNLAFRRRLPAQALAAFAERPFNIEVRDLGLAMAFLYVGRRFFPVPALGEPSLRLRVNAADFAALAAPEGMPCPDFLRDLVIVGDPQVATLVRESVAGLDVERTRRLLRRAARRAQRALAPE